LIGGVVDWKTGGPERIFGHVRIFWLSNLQVRGAVYDRSEHMVEEREISSFECAVCGATIEDWNSAWVPRYRFIACPAREAE
jgi:hypothetical protein